MNKNKNLKIDYDSKNQFNVLIKKKNIVKRNVNWNFKF